jgi:hypothetical protein
MIMLAVASWFGAAAVFPTRTIQAELPPLRKNCWTP